MGVKVKAIKPDAIYPVYSDFMMCDRRSLFMSRILFNSFYIYDWTRGVEEIICDVKLKSGYTCHFNHNHKNPVPGLIFREKETRKVVGFAQFKEDLTGIRDDIDYPFLEIEPAVEFPGFSTAGTMQSVRLKCD